MAKFVRPHNFVALYRQRLGFSPEKELTATVDTLFEISRAHLSHIPFENLAQHGCCGGKQTLDLHVTMDKILCRRRGGFCYELNLLLAEFLEALGFLVERLPATTFLGCDKPDTDSDGYRTLATHIFLLVQIKTESESDKKNNDANTGAGGPDSKTYIVDVAFGEPSLEPLVLEFHTEQATVEGMKSRVVLLPSLQSSSSEGGIAASSPPVKEASVERWVEDHTDSEVGRWTPRFKWTIAPNDNENGKTEGLLDAIPERFGLRSSRGQHILQKVDMLSTHPRTQSDVGWSSIEGDGATTISLSFRDNSSSGCK